MADNLFIRPTQIGGSVTPVSNGTATTGGTNRTEKSSFQEVFQKEIGNRSDVKFSSHALKRLESRNIKMTQDDLKLLNDAVNRAESKGARESLILMEDLALIVSVKNRTVITAVDGQSIKENVFTNIDSAVIAR